MDATLTEHDVSICCFSRILPMLDALRDCGTGRDRAGNRQLFFDDYCKSVLLFLFNPAINSLRLLQEASALPTVAKRLGVKRFSLGSFSEAPTVFQPALLKRAIAELSARANRLPVTPQLARLNHRLTILAGTRLATRPSLA